MRRIVKNLLAFALSALALPTLSPSLCRAQLVDVTVSRPTIDRWMYFQAQTPGVEQNISVFTTLGDALQLSFDDLDGQFLASWDTSSLITPGKPLNNYRIISAKVIARNSRSLGFRYDPTYDSYQTYLPSTDPLYSPDTDTGRPIELFMAGYRNGWDKTSFTETSPFCSPANDPNGCDPGILPIRTKRNVFAAMLDTQGEITDASNNILGTTGVEGGFEVRPLAIGVATTNAAQPIVVNPGDLVPNFTDFAFDIDLSNPDAITYLRSELAGGRVSTIISSLAVSAFMGGSPPRFYTKEALDQTGDLNRQPARLQIKVCVGRPADWNCDSSVTVQDLLDFFTDWLTGNADFNLSGSTSVQDILDFVSVWLQG